MGYFRFTPACKHYNPEWQQVIEQIQSWQPTWRDQLPRLSHPIEAKALHVFTIARRHVRATVQLAKADNGNWKSIFVEASSLLFPMIELVGEARKDSGGLALGAGIHWLRDPNYLPLAQDAAGLKIDKNRLNSLQTFMPERPQGPTVSDLFHLRNYYLHGVKSSNDPNISIADIINADLPEAIARHAEFAMREYWQQLKLDDGARQWVSRLAVADIHPFPIQGSDYFEAGLIDPEIVTYLEGPSQTVFSGTTFRN